MLVAALVPLTSCAPGPASGLEGAPEPEANGSEVRSQSAQHRLRLTDRVGSRQRYRLEFELRMNADYDGPDRDGRVGRLTEALGSGLRMRMLMVYEQRLQRVASDESRTFEFRWRDYEFDGQVNGEAVATPPGHTAAVDQLLSRAARVRTTALGEPLEIEYDAPEAERLAGTFRQMPGALPVYLPDRRVGPGDRWEGSVEIPLELPGGPPAVTFRLEHRLREFRAGSDGPIAVIEVRGSYSSLDGGGGRPPGAMHFQADLTGSAEFDVRAGWFRHGRYEIDMYAVEQAGDGEIHLTGHATGRLQGLDRG